MHSSTVSSKSMNINIDGGGDVEPPSTVLLSTSSTTGATVVDTVPVADGTQDDVSGARL